MDLLTSSKPAAPKVANPTIRIHVPLDPEETVNVNFTALAEAKYGWDALHPVAARLRALNRYDSDEESDSDMQDLTADGTSAPPTQQALPPAASQPKKRKRRKMNEYETYDIDDPFIDDDELNLQDLTAVSKDGFFVFQGPLVGEGDKVRIEKADGTQRRGNAPASNGAAGTAAAARRGQSRHKHKSTATASTAATSPGNTSTAAAPLAAIVSGESSTAAPIASSGATPQPAASVPGSPVVTKKSTQSKTPVAPSPARAPVAKTVPKSPAPAVPASQAIAGSMSAPAQAATFDTTRQTTAPTPSTMIPGSPVNSSDDPANMSAADAAATAAALAAKKPSKPRSDEQKRHMRENAARRRAQKKEETRLEVIRRALRNPLLDTSELQAAMAVVGGEEAISLQDVIRLTNRALGLAEHSAAASTEAKLRELDVSRQAPPLDMESIIERSKRVASIAMQSYVGVALDGGHNAEAGSGTTSPTGALLPPPTFASMTETSQVSGDSLGPATSRIVNPSGDKAANPAKYKPKANPSLVEKIKSTAPVVTAAASSATDKPSGQLVADKLAAPRPKVPTMVIDKSSKPKGISSAPSKPALAKTASSSSDKAGAVKTKSVPQAADKPLPKPATPVKHKAAQDTALPGASPASRSASLTALID